MISLEYRLFIKYPLFQILKLCSQETKNVISNHCLWCVIYLSFDWHLWLKFWENRFSKNSFWKICALVSVKIIRVWVAVWHAWYFFDYFFFFLFIVTHRYRIISIHTLSAPRIILRGENRVHSFIFGKLPHQVQIRWYNHILCKKNEFHLSYWTLGWEIELPWGQNYYKFK